MLFFPLWKKNEKPAYEELLEENSQLKQRVEQLLLHIESLELHIVKLEKIIFGLKSEKSGKNKKKDEKRSEVSNNTDETPENQAPKKECPKHSGGGRKGFPNNIPRQTVRVDLPDDEKCCSCCGEEYEPMGVGITEVLHLANIVDESVLR